MVTSHTSYLIYATMLDKCKDAELSAWFPSQFTSSRYQVRKKKNLIFDFESGANSKIICGTVGIQFL